MMEKTNKTDYLRPGISTQEFTVEGGIATSTWNTNTFESLSIPLDILSGDDFWE